MKEIRKDNYIILKEGSQDSKIVLRGNSESVVNFTCFFTDGNGKRKQFTDSTSSENQIFIKFGKKKIKLFLSGNEIEDEKSWKSMEGDFLSIIRCGESDDIKIYLFYTYISGKDDSYVLCELSSVNKLDSKRQNLIKGVFSFLGEKLSEVSSVDGKNIEYLEMVKITQEENKKIQEGDE